MRNPNNIQVHEFTDTHDAYDLSQCSDDIEMGDVLVVKSEKVVAFLLSAWPVAVTKEHGALHSFSTPTPSLASSPNDKRDWTLGFELHTGLPHQL